MAIRPRTDGRSTAVEFDERDSWRRGLGPWHSRRKVSHRYWLRLRNSALRPSNNHKHSNHITSSLGVFLFLSWKRFALKPQLKADGVQM